MKLRKRVHWYHYERNQYTPPWWLSSEPCLGLAYTHQNFSIMLMHISSIYAPLLAFTEEWTKFTWHLHEISQQLLQTPCCHHEMWMVHVDNIACIMLETFKRLLLEFSIQWTFLSNTQNSVFAQIYYLCTSIYWGRKRQPDTHAGCL